MHHRTRPVLFVILALFIGGCAQGSTDAAPYEGLWQSEGYGLYLDVAGGIDVYEYTSVSCGLVAGGSSRGSGGILGLANDRLVLTETGRTIWFDRIDVLPDACGGSFRSDDPVASFDVVVASMDEHYAFFDLRDPTWADRVAAVRAAMTPDTGDADLLDLLQNLLGPLGDAQVRIAVPDRELIPEGAWSASSPTADLVDLADRIRDGRVPGLTDVDVTEGAALVSGWLPDGVGYLAINRLAGFDDEAAAEERALADALLVALARFGEAEALVVDLRVNRGGRESLAMLTASRFVSEDTVVATRSVRSTNSDTYLDEEEVLVKRLPTGAYPATIVVLVGPGTSGAGELLALALREVPEAVLVGAPTAGSLSPLLVRELPNGWTLGLSHQRVLDVDGILWEGIGIPVDVLVDEAATDATDPVIEAALAALG